MPRRILIRKGKMAGEYTVFNDRDDFFKTFPNGTIKQWPKDAPFEVGDWVEAMDGFVLQLLNKYHPFKKSNKIDGRTHIMHVFANSAIIYTKSRVGIERYNNFYAMYMASSLTSVSGMDGGKYKDRDKIDIDLFAELLLAGKSIYKSYYIAFTGSKKPSKQDAAYKIRQLFKDKYLMDALENKLPESFKKIDEVISDKVFFEHIADLLKHSKKGSKEHRENIIFIGQLKAILSGGQNLLAAPSNETEPKDIKNVKDAEYTNIPNTEFPSDNNTD